MAISSSKGLDSRDTFEHTFVNEGDFSYFWTLHPSVETAWSRRSFLLGTIVSSMRRLYGIREG
jgi:hypothetical protein